MGYRLLASLSGSQDQMNQTRRAYGDFQACLPMAWSCPPTRHGVSVLAATGLFDAPHSSGEGLSDRLLLELATGRNGP